MEQETYLTVTQFAQLVNCDKYTIYHWIYANKLPHITINGTRTIRIPSAKPSPTTPPSNKNTPQNKNQNHRKHDDRKP